MAEIDSAQATAFSASVGPVSAACRHDRTRWLRIAAPPYLRRYARALRLPRTIGLRFALHGR